MEFKSKKEFLSFQLVILALILTVFSTILNIAIDNQGTLISTIVLSLIFIYGMVTYSMEKIKIKSDKLLKDMGIMYQLQNVNIYEHKFIKVPSYYSFYLVCEYIDFEGNLQEVKSKPLVVKKGSSSVTYMDGKFNLSCDFVVYVDKGNKEIYYIDTHRNEVE